jgi:hypothetical protein
VPKEDTQFKKGISGNPGGRPKGARELASHILSLTDDGEELVKMFLALARGEWEDANANDRATAMKWLADRAWGKPVEHVEHSGMIGIAEAMSAARQRVIDAFPSSS